MADPDKPPDSLLPPAVESYLQQLLPARPRIFAEMEARAAREKFPIIGPQTGALLALLIKISGVRTVFEMGSGFGYSAAWMASALPSGGAITLTDGDSGRLSAARGNLAELAPPVQLKWVCGDSLALLEKSHTFYDLIFCDVDKEAYPDAFKIASGLLVPGGLFVCDNTLWQGRVAAPGAMAPDTRAIHTMNQMAYGHPDYDCSIVPIRDGVLIARRHGPPPALPPRPGERPKRRQEDASGNRG
jgi:predicted O-methyltransferase YrrM